MTVIEPKLTERFTNDFKRNDRHKALQRGVVKNGILSSSETLEGSVNNIPVFSIDLETGKVTNQKQSGRCWLFAALNIFRHKLLNEFKLKDFELSQNYPFFGINMRKPITFMKIF